MPKPFVQITLVKPSSHKQLWPQYTGKKTKKVGSYWRLSNRNPLAAVLLEWVQSSCTFSSLSPSWCQFVQCSTGNLNSHVIQAPEIPLAFQASPVHLQLHYLEPHWSSHKTKPNTRAAIVGFSSVLTQPCQKEGSDSYCYTMNKLWVSNNSRRNI